MDPSHVEADSLVLSHVSNIASTGSRGVELVRGKVVQSVSQWLLPSCGVKR